jgi:hypothetical protein
MPSRQLPFNALPTPVRERLAKSFAGGGGTMPILAEKLGKGGVVGYAILSLLGFAGAFALMSADFGWSLHRGAGFYAGYAAAFFFAGLGAVLAARRALLLKSLPFPPGRYLLPMDFIDATGPRLTIVPLADLVDLQATHHHTNGAYTHSSLTLKFNRHGSETFVLKGKGLAEGALNELRSSRQALAAAAEAQQMAALAALDPLFEVRVKDAWDQLEDDGVDDGMIARTKPMPPVLESGGRAALVALAAAVVFSPVALFVRNRACDQAMFADAARQDTESAYESYLRRGGTSHEAEVRAELMPRAALAEAKRKNTVTALRAALKKYPDSVIEQEGRDAIHTLFQDTLVKFRAQAASEDPRMLPFMEALIAYLERCGSSTVQLRFDAPTSDSLEGVDRELAASPELRGYRVVPIASNFDEPHCRARESAIVTNLGDGFKTVFPNDILALTQGQRGGGSAPAIDIKYVVGPSGEFYTGERNTRAYVGIRVDFEVAMSVPGRSDPFQFTFQVVPPERFTVNYQSTSGLSFMPDAGGPSDSQVYEVMAFRAFDQLATKLKGVFFKDVAPPPAPEEGE